MKKTILLLLLLTCFTFGAQAQAQLKQDLDNLRTWMREKTNLADSTIRAEWPTVKKEYKEKTAAIDQNATDLSDSSKAEYAGMKQRYQQWEAENETRKEGELDSRELERWERQMTGTANIHRIKPANLRDSYVQSLEYTRQQRRDWSLRDWDYADFVMGELNTRKTKVTDRLSNSDKIKITALQLEFNTLKKSREAKDAYNNARDKK